MARKTDVPERILEALRSTSGGLTGAQIHRELQESTQLTERTVQIHLRKLFSEGRVEREFRYVTETVRGRAAGNRWAQDVGMYFYFLPTRRKAQ